MSREYENENAVFSYPRLRSLSPKELTLSPWVETIQDGRYNALRLADLMGWTNAEMAGYLGKTGGALSRQPAASKDQRMLGTLVGLLAAILDLTGGNMDALKAWLNTPTWTFDQQCAKDLMQKNELGPIYRLLQEFDSGTVA